MTSIYDKHESVVKKAFNNRLYHTSKLYNRVSFSTRSDNSTIQINQSFKHI